MYLPQRRFQSAVVFAIGAALFLAAYVTADCPWTSGDDFKMHWPQEPNNVTGWLIDATYPVTLADDWQCSENGWIKEIHFWGMWGIPNKNTRANTIDSFYIAIHANATDHPGTVLWQKTIPLSAVDTTRIVHGGLDGWYDPNSFEPIPDLRNYHYQYDICLDTADWFWQNNEDIYWLSISAYVSDPYGDKWGWITSLNRWNNRARRGTVGGSSWTALNEPNEWDPFFRMATIAIDSLYNYVTGGGTDYYGSGWYYYPQTAEWMIWFAAPPFDSLKYRISDYGFSVTHLAPSYPGNLEVFINWSTDLWSIEQPGSATAPPLPGDNTSRYVGSQSVYSDSDFDGNQYGAYTISEYDPEWIAIGVRGYNFNITSGGLTTRDEPSWTPAHMAFVLTGDSLGRYQACCLDETCLDNIHPDTCLDWGGIPTGGGDVCSGETVACCFPDSSCQELDITCCWIMGGTPSAWSSGCVGDDNGNGIDDACEEVLGACCQYDALCSIETEANCTFLGGTYLGNWTICLDDNNLNGADDACETPYWPEADRKMAYQQRFYDSGWAVNATAPMILANDWQCSETGPITDIHFWGAWKDDLPGIVTRFNLAIYADIPADPPAIPYSRPGAQLWSYTAEAFNPKRLMLADSWGWYDPAEGYVETQDHSEAYQYSIYLPESDWFPQDSGTMYWLSISAELEDAANTKWGWTSSYDLRHWISVWAYTDQYLWIDMWPPPTFTQALDLSFIVFNSLGCDCRPGDANGDGNINVGDAVYLISYVFKGGPPPYEFATCAGDANCDCTCNVGDAVYIISYVFKGGPPPCDCRPWLSLCGYPLRK